MKRRFLIVGGAVLLLCGASAAWSAGIELPDVATNEDAKQVVNKVVKGLMLLLYIVGGAVALLGTGSAAVMWMDNRPDEGKERLKNVAIGATVLLLGGAFVSIFV